MQQPTDQIAGKVCDEKNRDECGAFQKQRRQVPPLRGVTRRGLSPLRCKDKPRDQAQQRKNFAKKTSKKPSQTEESQDAGKNHVDPVHSPKPLRARAKLPYARQNPRRIIPLCTRLEQSIEPFEMPQTRPLAGALLTQPEVLSPTRSLACRRSCQRPSASPVSSLYRDLERPARRLRRCWPE